jgi:hypothetical protein
MGYFSCVIAGEAHSCTDNSYERAFVDANDPDAEWERMMLRKRGTRDAEARTA